MNEKEAKRLRRSLRAAHLPESPLLINKKTGVIRRGWGLRAAYQRLKRLNLERRAVLVAGLAPSKKEAEVALHTG